MNGTVEIDSARLIAELAGRIGSLGVEVADIAGNLEEVTGRISNQAAQCEELEQTAQTMVSGNRAIDHAARADPRIVFCVAWARGGYLPTHNPNYCQPQSNDPVWNAGTHLRPWPPLGCLPHRFSSLLKVH
jgi:hypothetical protein